MRIIQDIDRMQKISKRSRQHKNRIGFVPTMGALHAGHLSLIRRARRENDLCVVSIFVNPLQFGPKEDYKKYPRTIRRDVLLCRREGVDIIFTPQAKKMYRGDCKTSVGVRDLSISLCGRRRPGHFKGVATVVAKLLNIIVADTAYFGQKDAQQALIIKRMVGDLNIPVKIRVMPTIRETDGLAVSSRNSYLTAQERLDAAVLYQSLRSAKKASRAGERDAKKIIAQIKKVILKKKSARIDYVSLVDSRTLEAVKKVSGETMAALAVWIGGTRLIDNVILN